MAHYVIGDVQGCRRSLLALVDKIGFRPGVDRITLAGDLIARGPDSLGVMQWVLDHQDCVDAVLGNHDLNFLAVAVGHRDAKPNDRIQALLDSTALDAIVSWFRSCHLGIDLPEHRALIVHAGVWPGWNRNTWLNEVEAFSAHLSGPDWVRLLAEMYGNAPSHPEACVTTDDRLRFMVNASTRMRMVHRDTQALELTFKQHPAEGPEHLVAWMDSPNRVAIDRQIVFGHWALLNGERRSDAVFALDTGCVYGRRLTALRLDCRRCFEVDCAEFS